MKMTKAFSSKDIERKWVVVDAKDKVFGRLLVEVATALSGKNKPTYTPNVDCGDYVVIINASQVKLTNLKEAKKIYYRHSGYVGSIKEETFESMLERNPEKLFFKATRGMLPKSKLGRAMIKKLKVYTGDNHPHTAQIKEGK